MKKLLLLGSCCVLLMMTMCATAWSSSILSTVVHDYGTGQWDPAGTDSLYDDYVLVKDSSAGRFSDSFDFSDLSYDSIEKFELTLTYTNANDVNWFIFPEEWYVRPGGTGSTTDSSPYMPFKLTSSSSGLNNGITFTIDASLDEFSKMVEDEIFFFWLAEESRFSEDFKLYGATLNIYGDASDLPSPTPEPTTILLFGLGLLGVAGVSRRKVQA